MIIGQTCQLITLSSKCAMTAPTPPETPPRCCGCHRPRWHLAACLAHPAARRTCTRFNYKNPPWSTNAEHSVHIPPLRPLLSLPQSSTATVPWYHRGQPRLPVMTSHTKQIQADLYGNRSSSRTNHSEFTQGHQHTQSGMKHQSKSREKPLDYIFMHPT